MQRLTKRSSVDGRFAVLSDEMMEVAKKEMFSPWQIIDLLVQRLARYEAIGKSPEEIVGIINTHKELKEKAMPLISLATEGRLQKVPKIGKVFYEADAKHGVVMHEVTGQHWAVDTEATDGNGIKWADRWTDEDFNEAFDNDKDAMKKLEEISK